MADRPATEPRQPREPGLGVTFATGMLRAFSDDDLLSMLGRVELEAKRRGLPIEAEAAQGAASLDQHEGGPLCIDCDKPFQHQRSSGSDAPLRAKATATSEGAAPRAEGLVPALAYALARADLPTDMETSRDYAERLAPLVIESGWLSRPSDERVPASWETGAHPYECLCDDC